MNLRFLVLWAFTAFGSTGFASAEEWTSINNAEEVRSIVVEQTLLVFKSRHQFHRRDGNMVEYYTGNQSYTLRKWKLREDGSVCWMIFSKPEHVIDCAEIQRGPDDKLRYRLEHSQGAAPVEILDADSASLINELETKAGNLE